MSESLTPDEFLSLFGCEGRDVRWMPSADSGEFLALVTYLTADPLKTRYAG